MRFDTASKALYATDASNYRQVPLGVVIPKTFEDVVATHRACHEFGAPIVCRGGGTSLSGETVNFAVVIDFSKYLHRHRRRRRRNTDRHLPAGRDQRAGQPEDRPADRHDLRPRPLDPLPLHDRRQRRQQLVRHPLGAVSALRSRAAHLRQRRGARDRHPRRRALLGRRGRGGEPRRDHRRRRPQGRDLRAAARPARPLRRSDPRALPAGRPSCRAVSPATTSTSCCPSAASTSPVPWSAPRARAPRCCRSSSS